MLISPSQNEVHSQLAENAEILIRQFSVSVSKEVDGAETGTKASAEASAEAAGVKSNDILSPSEAWIFR